MTTLVIFVLAAIIFVLLYTHYSLLQELNGLYKECETMYHRDRKTGRIAKGLREPRG